MLWLFLALIGISLCVAMWWLWPQPVEPARPTWVLAREGLVRFEGTDVLHVDWQAVQRLEAHPTFAILHLHRRPSVRVEGHEVDEGLARFVKAATMAVHDPERRRTFPTFMQPEGPPEAVLADLEPTGDPMQFKQFTHDLKKLCLGLDPVKHADELQMVQRCSTIADLDHLAEDGGWLTKPRRGPRVKLVKHGSGTFLLVSYDDGWSSTLSQAPFRTR